MKNIYEMRTHITFCYTSPAIETSIKSSGAKDSPLIIIIIIIFIIIIIIIIIIIRDHGQILRIATIDAWRP